MNNGQMELDNENPTQQFALMIEENHEKTPVRLVGTGIWTQHLPNASLMRYHGATWVSNCSLFTGVGWAWTREPWAHWQTRYQCAILTDQLEFSVSSFEIMFVCAVCIKIKRHTIEKPHFHSYLTKLKSEN